VLQYSVGDDTVTYSYSTTTITIHVSNISESTVSGTLTSNTGESYGPFTMLHLGGAESIYCAW
jgi:hypothetical protein